LRGIHAHQAAIYKDAPAVRPIYSREDFNNGGFAGAILADYCVHLTFAKSDIYVAQGMDAGEILGDTPKLDGRNRNVLLRDVISYLSGMGTRGCASAAISMPTSR
jgi:hypothetical protein